MKLLPHAARRVGICVAILGALTLPLSSIAQAPQTESNPADAKNAPRIVETIHLANATSQRDLTDVQNDLRNMLPMAIVYVIQAQHAISIRATAEEMETAKKLIADLDRPHKAYRVTYTVTEVDNGKPVATQQLAVVVAAGEKSVLKHGNRVPILTGMFGKEGPEQSSQVQYLDVGLNLDASLDGDRLRSKVEQTSVSEEKSGIGMQDPIVCQTMLESISDLAPGKKMVLGSLDVPGTTRRLQIEAVAEPAQ